MTLKKLDFSTVEMRPAHPRLPRKIYANGVHVGDYYLPCHMSSRRGGGPRARHEDPDMQAELDHWDAWRMAQSRAARLKTIEDMWRDVENGPPPEPEPPLKQARRWWRFGS